jgi:hypothetical protein
VRALKDIMHYGDCLLAFHSNSEFSSLTILCYGMPDVPGLKDLRGPFRAIVEVAKEIPVISQGDYTHFLLAVP